MLNHTRWTIGALSIALSISAAAQTNLEVSWGSSLLPQKMIRNDGSALDSGPLTIEVGSFGTFTPTASNMDQWLTNWKVFDAITEPDSDPNGSDFMTYDANDSTLARFAGSANLTDGQLSDSEDAALQNPTATFGPNEQGYVFFRTGDAYIEDNQWLLFTSAVDADGAGLEDSVWEFPSISGGQPQFSLAWWLDQADTAIVGAINGGDIKGGSTGAGCFTDTSDDFAIRLHCVPEPSTGILALLSAVALLRRKRR